MSTHGFDTNKSLQCTCAMLTLGKRRFALYDTLAWLRGVPPSEGLLVGALLLGSAGACASLLRSQQLAGRLRTPLILTAGLGCLLLLLQPPLPIQASVHCDVSWS